MEFYDLIKFQMLIVESTGIKLGILKNELIHFYVYKLGHWVPSLIFLITNTTYKERMRAQSKHPSSVDDDKSIDFKKDKLLTALFYGVTSFAVIFVNKSVMTDFDFPYFDFLAFFQFLVTTIILGILIWFRKIDVPTLNYDIFIQVFPISIMFLGNIISGLGGTRSLNLPMFTVLRRFSILMTMIAEFMILGVKPTSPIVISVAMMVSGALLAAMYDLRFDALGYFMIFLNNTFTTLNGVWMKKASLSGRCNKMGLLFYNSMFSAIVMFLFFTCEHVYISNLKTAHLQGSVSGSVSRNLISTLSVNVGSADIHGSSTVYEQVRRALASTSTITNGQLNSEGEPNKMNVLGLVGWRNSSLAHSLSESINKYLHSFDTTSSAAIAEEIEIPELMYYSTISKTLAHENWSNWKFLVAFLTAASMGSVLNYSIFLCTTVNSALTTAVVGCLKNVATTYIGMVVFADYQFNWLNFVGLNISIAGSLYYTYMTMFKGSKDSAVVE